MERNKLELDRCILFPRTEEALTAIDSKEIDNRYEIELIDLDYSSLSKLEIFGFFSYPKDSGLSVVKNSFVKIPTNLVSVGIDVALSSRKETNDKELLRLIDRFVEMSKRSNKQGLPIWFNT